MYKTNIHDYQLGVLKTYRDNPKIEEFEDYFLIESNYHGKMQFCYSKNAPIVCEKRDYLEQVDNSEERVETIYEIDKVFDRSSYETGKKYQDKVKRWLNYFEKHNYSIKELSANSKKEVNDLYSEWINLKGLDEAMIKRYQDCINFAFNESENSIKIIGMFDENNKLVGFRTFYMRDDGWAFDLSNTCTRNSYKYMSEIFQVNTIKYLKDTYKVNFYNLGLSDGSLRLHKTLLPNFEISYFVVR